MELKQRISSFIKQLLSTHKLTQREFALILGTKQGRLNAYIKAKEMPRVEVLLKLAEIGGVSMDDLLKTNKPPAKTVVKHVFEYEYQPGDLTEEQAAKLEELVDEIVNLEQTGKKKYKSPAAIWGALKRRFGVTHYRKIPTEDFEKAVAYLKMRRGRLLRPVAQKDKDSYRKEKCKAIISVAKNLLGWRREEVDNYIFAEFEVDSIKKLNEKQLETLHNKIMKMKPQMEKE